MNALTFRDLRQRIGRLITCNYDIADRCNLHCEGCHFFTGDDYKKYRNADDLEAWRRFFQMERARGVNFGYFAGAEPSLEIDRLRIAHEHIARGVVFSNGLIKIPDDISYRIHVSIWGDEGESRAARGAGIAKALANYARDRRAVFIFTLTASNVDTIYDVSRSLADRGAVLTFNLFSPTTKYLDTRVDLDESDRRFFRRRRTAGDPTLTPSDIDRATGEILRAMQDFPEAVLYSAVFHRWLTRSGGLYRLDPATGIATNCGYRLSKAHRCYNFDLSLSTAKCATPNIDCASCRAYPQSYATFLKERANPRKREALSGEWLEVWDIWARLFLGDAGPQTARTAVDEKVLAGA
jgi:hypothetical protein